MTERVDIQKGADIDEPFQALKRMPVGSEEVEQARQCGTAKRCGVSDEPMYLFQRTAGDAKVEIFARITANPVNAIALAVAVIGDTFLPESAQRLRRFERAARAHGQNCRVKTAHGCAREHRRVERLFRCGRTLTFEEGVNNTYFVSPVRPAPRKHERGFVHAIFRHDSNVLTGRERPLAQKFADQQNVAPHQQRHPEHREEPHRVKQMDRNGAW